MDVFQKCFEFEDAEKIRKVGLYPYFRVIESGQDPVVTMNGQRVIMLGSNNYLGLTNHPEVKAAAARALDTYGTGVGVPGFSTAPSTFTSSSRRSLPASCIRSPC